MAITGIQPSLIEPELPALRATRGYMEADFEKA